jgi:hypothetical protein
MAREESSSAKKVQPKTSRVECKNSAKGFADNLIDIRISGYFHPHLCSELLESYSSTNKVSGVLPVVGLATGLGCGRCHHVSAQCGAMRAQPTNMSALGTWSHFHGCELETTLASLSSYALCAVS